MLSYQPDNTKKGNKNTHQPKQSFSNLIYNHRKKINQESQFKANFHRPLKKLQEFTGQITGTSLNNIGVQNSIDFYQTHEKNVNTSKLKREYVSEPSLQSNPFYDICKSKKPQKFLMPKVYQLNYDENFVNEKELVSSGVAKGTFFCLSFINLNQYVNNVFSD